MSLKKFMICCLSVSKKNPQLDCNVSNDINTQDNVELGERASAVLSAEGRAFIFQRFPSRIHN